MSHINPDKRFVGQAEEQFEELLREQTREVEQFSVARPVISPVEFESNPIVRVYPTTGKHYPMRVVRRSVASFKLTFQREYLGSKNEWIKIRWQD